MAATLSHKLVSLAEAADVLAVSTKTVRRYIADGHLDAVRLGRKTLRIKLDSIERFIGSCPVGGWSDRLSGQRRAQKRPRRVMAAPLGREAASSERCIVAALERRKAPELAFPQFRGLFTTLPRLDSNQQPAG